jgi:hypothetical protein
VAPTPLYIALCVGGPPTTNRLGAPAKGARTSPTAFGPLGLGEIETNIAYSEYEKMEILSYPFKIQTSNCPNIYKTHRPSDHYFHIQNIYSIHVNTELPFTPSVPKRMTF